MLRNQAMEMKFIVAAAYGDSKTICALLQKGIDINCQNKNEETALTKAAFQGHLDVVQELLAKGANVHLKDDQGNNALIGAASTGNTKIVRELLKKGANISINHQNTHGNNALILAAMQGQSSVVRELLKWGADLSYKNIHGKTALTAAIHNNKKEVIKIIEKEIQAREVIYKKQKEGIHLFFLGKKQKTSFSFFKEKDSEPLVYLPKELVGIIDDYLKPSK